MRNFLKLFFVFLFSIFLISCTSNSKKQIDFVLNPWVGYTPFFYMYEKGWLDSDDIHIIPVTSLSESVKLFESGKANLIGATQQELKHLSHTADVLPFMLLDRSNGADAIFSNISLEKLKVLTTPVNVLLELNSVNELLFDLFVKKNGLDISNFRLINTDQLSISRKILLEEPTILVTYEPYLSDVAENGYSIIADSNDEGLYILDILIIDSRMKSLYADELAALQSNFYKALKVLEADPKEYYETVKMYLDGQSYEEFLESLDGIKWMSQKDQKLLEKID